MSTSEILPPSPPFPWLAFLRIVEEDLPNVTHPKARELIGDFVNRGWAVPPTSYRTSSLVFDHDGIRNCWDSENSCRYKGMDRIWYASHSLLTDGFHVRSASLEECDQWEMFWKSFANGDEEEYVQKSLAKIQDRRMDLTLPAKWFLDDGQLFRGRNGKHDRRNTTQTCSNQVADFVSRGDGRGRAIGTKYIENDRRFADIVQSSARLWVSPTHERFAVVFVPLLQIIECFVATETDAEGGGQYAGVTLRWATDKTIPPELVWESETETEAVVRIVGGSNHRLHLFANRIGSVENLVDGTLRSSEKSIANNDIALQDDVLRRGGSEVIADYRANDTVLSAYDEDLYVCAYSEAEWTEYNGALHDSIVEGDDFDLYVRARLQRRLIVSPCGRYFFVFTPYWFWGDMYERDLETGSVRYCYTLKRNAYSALSQPMIALFFTDPKSQSNSVFVFCFQHGRLSVVEPATGAIRHSTVGVDVFFQDYRVQPNKEDGKHELVICGWIWHPIECCASIKIKNLLENEKAKLDVECDW
jgi:hypothetical protein